MLKSVAAHSDSILMTTLAFDYGQKRVGVAVSFSSLAEPLDIIANDQDLWSRVAQLINEYHVRQLLVGISEGQSGERAEKFGEQLKVKFDLPVLFADETLSTQGARSKLRQGAMNSKSHQAVDHYAAAEILQNWLDEGCP